MRGTLLNRDTITGRYGLRSALAALLVSSFLQVGCSGEPATETEATAEATAVTPDVANATTQNPQVNSKAYGSWVKVYYTSYANSGYGSTVSKMVQLTNDHSTDCAAAKGAVDITAPPSGGYGGSAPVPVERLSCSDFATAFLKRDYLDPGAAYLAQNETWKKAKPLNPIDPTICYQPKIVYGSLSCGVTTCGYGGTCTTRTQVYDTCTVDVAWNRKSWGYATDLAGLVKDLRYMPPGGQSQTYHATATTVGHAITVTDSNSNSMTGSVGLGFKGSGTNAPGAGANFSWSQGDAWSTAKKWADDLSVAFQSTYPNAPTGADVPDHLRDAMDLWINYDLAIFNKCPTSWMGTRTKGVSPVDTDFAGFLVKSKIDAPWIPAEIAPGTPVMWTFLLKDLIYPVTTTQAYADMFGGGSIDAVKQAWLWSTAPTTIACNGTTDIMECNSEANTLQPGDPIPSTSCDGVHRDCHANGVQRFTPATLKKIWSIDPFFDDYGHQVPNPDLTRYVDGKGKRRFVPVQTTSVACDPNNPATFLPCSSFTANDQDTGFSANYDAGSLMSYTNSVSQSYSDSFDFSLSWVLGGGVSTNNVVSWSQDSSDYGAVNYKATFNFATAKSTDKNCFVGNMFIDTFNWQFAVPGVVCKCSDLLSNRCVPLVQ